MRPLAALAMLGLCGCGASFQSSANIAWKSNGNPGVPVCSGAQVNCVSNVAVHDKTTGNIAVAAPTNPGSVTMPNASDSFEIETNGFDGDGQPLSSGYVPVPSATQ